jgi:3-oxoacyl-[acyl-carrier-protein] synthase-1
MYKIGDNIISSLGFTTDENYHAVKQGISGIIHYEAGTFGLPYPFIASLIDKERLLDAFATICRRDAIHGISSSMTPFEKAAILSVFTANKETQIDLANPRTLFILSSTKGNVDLLNTRFPINRYSISDPPQSGCELSGIGLRAIEPSFFLWHSAELIAQFFKNRNTPVVVSNACISGAAAQITAKRALQSGKYDHAVVVGADFLSKFIISGFQAFKALAPELCKPFDKNRCGLNLGEAAATLIFSREETKHAPSLQCGAIRNDATHISAPSRTGEGSFRALKSILSSNLKSQNLISQIAFINAHGTATSYNDAAEMNAIARAGLENIPVNALKSNFGHTLGAAGVLETIISIRALHEGIILKTLGFEESETLIINNEQLILNICKETIHTDKKYFIKMMSGFGGVNAALLYCINP